MKKSHVHETTKVSTKGVLTYYLYDVWTLELSEELFRSITKSSKIFISPKIKIPHQTHLKVASHCGVLDSCYPKRMDQITLPRTRVSISALVNLTYKGQSIYLIQDRVIKPFGGAYQFTTFPSLPSLKLDDPSSLDLRFSIDSSEIQSIKPWFESGLERELTPCRELIEELSEENLILTKDEVLELISIK